LERQAERLEDRSTAGLKELAAVIARHSLSLADLKSALRMNKKSGKGLGQGRGKRGALAGRSVAPKYRDGDGNTWSGRGLAPKWLVAAEKAGQKRESFLIASAGPSLAQAKSRKKV
jgi:DNA-binding protein H-NS